MTRQNTATMILDLRLVKKDEIVGKWISVKDLEMQSVSSIGSTFSRDDQELDIDSDAEKRFSVSNMDSLPRIPRSSNDLQGPRQSQRRRTRRTKHRKPNLNSKLSAPVLGDLNTTSLPINATALSSRWESTISFASSRWETSTATKTNDQCSEMTVRMPRRRRSRGFVEELADPTTLFEKELNKNWSIGQAKTKKDISPRRIQRRVTEEEGDVEG